MNLPAAIALAIALSVGASAALAQVPSPAQTGRKRVDRIAVRYYAPETGGSSQPRFVSERVLAFEARVLALAEQAPSTSAYEDRFVRAALDRHVAEDMLSAMAVQLPAAARSVPELADEQRQGLVESVGGEAALRSAMDAEGIDQSELDALVRRRARAAWYVNHALTPLLRPTEEQLREVFRTGSHPFKSRSFDQVHDALERWFVEERLRVAETSFLQAAQARVRIVCVTCAAGTR